MIRFICVRCRQMLEVRPEFAGRQAKCTRCGQLLLVPAAAPQPASVPPTPPPPTPPRRAPLPPVSRPTPPPPPPIATIQLTCSCGQWLEIDDGQFGKLIQCPTCGQTTQAPQAPGVLMPSSPEFLLGSSLDARRLASQLPVWAGAGGMLGVLLGGSLGVNFGSGGGSLLYVTLGTLLGGGVGAMFLAFWIMRFKVMDWLYVALAAGAIIGATLGGALLAGEVSGFVGAVLGALLGTAAGVAGGQVWRNLDRP